jgi:DNA polymerase-3 subunit delta'
LISGKEPIQGVKDHPDYMVVEPEKSQIRIDQIREVQRMASLSSSSGWFRVCIIDGADRMETPAANSLLKILEEPPESFLFILITAYPDALLTTIRSRSAACQFSGLSRQDVVEVLQKQGVELSEAELVSHLCGGSIGEGLRLSRPDARQMRNRVWEALQKSGTMQKDWLWPVVDELDEADAAQTQLFVKYWVGYLRDMAVIQQGQEKILFNPDKLDQLRQLASSTDGVRIADAVRFAEDTRRHLMRNANARLMMEAMLIRSADRLWGGKINAECCGNPV